MKYLYRLFIVVFLVGVSCGKTKSSQKTPQQSDSLKEESYQIKNTIAETLLPEARKAVEDWKEYQEVDKFLLRYYNISVNEALNNAQELSVLAKQMKDSIRVPELTQPSVVARLNVLYNETLRLADMEQISAITPNEVKEEVFNILEIFSALNAKINTIYKSSALKASLGIDTVFPAQEEEIEIKEIKKEDSKFKKSILPISKKIGKPEFKKLTRTRKRPIKKSN